ncbi:MAG: Swt1 family HEPN domain-containing protein, partial [Candidatus Methanofastidiosia archaeon]
KKIQNLLSEHGILSSTPSYTHSGVGKRVMVGPPNLYTFFEKKFLKLSEIRNFEKRFSEITKRFTIFRLLYNYSRYKREHLRKLWDQLPKRELEEVLSELKNLEIIKEDFRNLESFRILKVQSYKNYLEKNLYKDSLNEIRYILVSPGEEIRENSQAYVLLSRFEEELRDFIKRTLREAYGEEWYKVGVPDFVRRKLDERVEDARKRGRKLYSPLSYSDFSFYLSIILHKIKKGSNWELFEKHFVSIGWIKGRLIELAEIRNDIAHPKPLQSIQYRKLQLYIDEIMGRMDKIPQN